jgi:hypothetical protein
MDEGDTVVFADGPSSGKHTMAELKGHGRQLDRAAIWMLVTTEDVGSSPQYWSSPPKTRIWSHYLDIGAALGRLPSGGGWYFQSIGCDRQRRRHLRIAGYWHSLWCCDVFAVARRNILPASSNSWVTPWVCRSYVDWLAANANGKPTNAQTASFGVTGLGVTSSGRHHVSFRPCLAS